MIITRACELSLFPQVLGSQAGSWFALGRISLGAPHVGAVDGAGHATVWYEQPISFCPGSMLVESCSTPLARRVTQYALRIMLVDKLIANIMPCPLL